MNFPFAFFIPKEKITMPRPVHFEIHATDPLRAIDFYSTVFGWKFQEYMPNFYWLITTGEAGTPGIDGGLNARNATAAAHGASPNAFVCTMNVEDLDATIAAVTQAGGQIAMEKHHIPGNGWLAYFFDTEGNLFGTMQMDAPAA
jgi:hypothetical protein